MSGDGGAPVLRRLGAERGEGARRQATIDGRSAIAVESSRSETGALFGTIGVEELG